DPEKKQRRNAYMRFTRSINSPNAPQEVIDAFEKCKDSKGKTNRGKLQKLFATYMDAGEDWGQSDLILTSEQSNLNLQRSQYKLMTRRDRH
ncbi:hypothetical protein AK812_SmicGene48326, partial [Symbiodinium microadriaticum]